MRLNLFNFQKKLENSFLNIKKDINLLQNEISLLKNELKEQKGLILSLIEEKSQNKPYFEEKNPKIEDKKISSIGNKGVYSFIHSFNSYSFTKYSDIQKLFSTLSKQEFLTFLTIYQLSEEKNNKITYVDISQKLGLSEGCIRTYVSSLLKKQAPIIKEKVNNKFIYLSINEEFRKLNLKNQLISLFYDEDPHQKHLSTNY